MSDEDKTVLKVYIFAILVGLAVAGLAIYVDRSLNQIKL